MALATHLADTSVYARLHVQSVTAAVAPLIDRGLVATCSVVDLEMGYSARSRAECESLAEERSGFELLDMDQSVWDAAAATQRALAADGRLRAVGIPDLLIAATAAHHRVTVLHYNRDFDHIASVTGQPVQWAVPPGSLD
ncbi:MAG: PIN domain nuclease [Kineosporiaceae bacterium]